eukprot:5485612-Lingulodinium_polyedra.AAC.1
MAASESLWASESCSHKSRTAMRSSVLPPWCRLSGALGGARSPGGASEPCLLRLPPDCWLPHLCP